MKRWTIVPVVCVAAWTLTVWAAGATAADLARKLTIQGRLDTSSGAPASGTFDLVVRLFAAQTGGSALYQEAAVGVQVAGGLFDREIGPVPSGVLEGASSLWLEVQVGSDTLPRRPLGAVPYALVAQQANVALSATGVVCTGCVDPAEVSFAYAAGATKGGAAVGLECTGCVETAALATGAVGGAQLQAGAVTSDKAGFTYAGSATKGGAAQGLSCTGCVGSGHLAANLDLAGDVDVAGSLAACTAGVAGCDLTLGDATLAAANTGWLTVRMPNGLRLRDAADGDYRPIYFGGGAAAGSLEITGGLAVGADASVGGGVSLGGNVGTAIELVSSTGGALGVLAQGGARVRNAGDSAWAPLAAGATAVHGTLAADGAATVAALTVSGKAGVGTAPGAVQLKLAGGLQLGNESAACAPATAGTLRWTGAAMELCDGQAYSSGPRLPLWTTDARPSPPALGVIGYNTDLAALEVYTGVWTAIGGSSAPMDPGGGGGFTVGQGADDSVVSGYTNASMTHYESAHIRAASGNGNPLYYGCTGSSANFAFHTGHQVPAWWPTYMAVNVTGAPQGKVLNQIEWYKHVNAVGNVDVFGSNKDITSGNFSSEGNWTWLGRINLGGSGSQPDCTVRTGIFNPGRLGFRWYMVKAVDYTGANVAYPAAGPQGGWAMYGLRLNTSSGGGARYWRYVEGSATASHHPRVSRIVLTDADGNDTTIASYTGDNCSDSGTYQIGTVTKDFGVGTSRRIVKVTAYSVYSAGLRAANYQVQYSNDNSTWTTYFAGVLSNQSSCGIMEGTMDVKYF